MPQLQVAACVVDEQHETGSACGQDLSSDRPLGGFSSRHIKQDMTKKLSPNKIIRQGMTDSTISLKSEVLCTHRHSVRRPRPHNARGFSSTVNNGLGQRGKRPRLLCSAGIAPTGIPVAHSKQFEPSKLSGATPHGSLVSQVSSCDQNALIVPHKTSNRILKSVRQRGSGEILGIS